MKNWLHGRGPLLAYIGLFLVAAVLINVVAKPIINNYVERTVQQRVEKILHTQEICRQGASDEIKNCRALIDRVVHAATAKQEHSTAVRLFRTLTIKEIRQLGLQGPRGLRGARGPRGLSGTKGSQGAAGMPGQVTPGANQPIMPPPQSPKPNNPPGPKGNPNNPPCPLRNPNC